jgi:hypothetical protein
LSKKCFEMGFLAAAEACQLAESLHWVLGKVPKKCQENLLKKA